MPNRTLQAALVLRAAFVLLAWALTTGLPRQAWAQSSGPSGWKTEAVGANAVMTPPDLAAGEFFQITVFPRTSRNGAVITDFLGAFADRETTALGTIHDGLPVPPDEMDVPLSRRREPEHWGRWRRQGTQYLASWPDQPNHFEPLKGEMTLPAKTGEQLAGRFSTGSTSGSMITGGGWSIRGVKFSPSARFQKDKRGGYSSGSLGQTMNGFSMDTAYNDEGTATLAVSPGVSVSTGSKKPGGHRGGTYSLSGYVLTLHYDDGRTAHLPFFFTSAKRNEIYFEGATLAFDKDK